MFQNKFPNKWIYVLLLSIVLSLAGCAQQMADQPNHRPLSASNFFKDGQASRPLVLDTVSRSDTANSPDQSTIEQMMALPFPITMDVLSRGQQRYDIFCAVCHDRVGTGNGMIVQRGFTRPPSLHIDSLRTAPVGHFFNVITNGYNDMPAYADQIPVDDRWKIIAYIRALQLSQHAPTDDVPPDVLKTLERNGS